MATLPDQLTYEQFREGVQVEEINPVRLRVTLGDNKVLLLEYGNQWCSHWSEKHGEKWRRRQRVLSVVSREGAIDGAIIILRKLEKYGTLTPKIIPSNLEGVRQQQGIECCN